MSYKSTIEWTDASWNPVRGCDKVSAGCKNCYAETFAERWRGIKGHPFEQGFDLRLVPEALDNPIRWKRPRRIFVNSMSDLFHEGVPFEYIAAVFGVMAACPQHTFQVLTKRPERAVEFFDWLNTASDTPMDLSELGVCLTRARRVLEFNRALDHHGQEWPLPNVHLGVSAENQEAADERIPMLLKCHAAVRFVSAEPLLHGINFHVKHLGQGSDCAECGFGVLVDDDGCCSACGSDAMWYGVDHVIVGGESGPGARPCNVGWIRSIIEQCKASGVPAFCKQLGANVRDVLPWSELPASTDERAWPGIVAAVGDRIILSDRKGGDPSEWPEDIRVRMFPGETWP